MSRLTQVLAALALGSLCSGCSAPIEASDAGVDAPPSPDVPPDTPPPPPDSGCPGTDADGDGHCSVGTGGDDCDDTRRDRHPENTEVCTAAAAAMGDRAIDEDCDRAVDEGCDWFVGNPHPVATIWAAGTAMVSADPSADGIGLYVAARVSGTYRALRATRTSTGVPFGAVTSVAGPDTGGRLHASRIAIGSQEVEAYTVSSDGARVEVSSRLSPSSPFGARTTVLAEPTATYESVFLSADDLELIVTRRLTWVRASRLHRMTRATPTSTWSALEPLELDGAPSLDGETGASLSRDRLSLFFTDVDTGLVRVARRASPDDASFGPAIELTALGAATGFVPSEASGEVFFESTRSWAFETTATTLWRARLCRDAACPETLVECPAPGVRSDDGLHCYDETTGGATWDAARTACEMLAPAGEWHLVTVNSQAETDLLLATFTPSYSIGLRRPSGLGMPAYAWITGEPLLFTAWDASQPSYTDGVSTQEECVELRVPGLWNDLSCAGGRTPICERELYPSW